MKQGRDTTQKERVQIVKDCLASGKNYGEMALKYQGYAVSDVKIDGESVGAVTSYSFENVRKAHNHCGKLCNDQDICRCSGGQLL